MTIITINSVYADLITVILQRMKQDLCAKTTQLAIAAACSIFISKPFSHLAPLSCHSLCDVGLLISVFPYIRYLHNALLGVAECSDVDCCDSRSSK
jgi:hypothetical protein